MGIAVSNNFDINSPKPIDSRQGKFSGGAGIPFATTTEANTATAGKRYVGLTVLIGSPTVFQEYWYYGGITDGSLIPKAVEGATAWGGIGGAIADQADLTAYVLAQVNAAVTALTTGAPGALDTLNELAAALADDANFAATMTTALAGKQATLTATTFADILEDALSNDGNIAFTRVGNVFRFDMAWDGVIDNPEAKPDVPNAVITKGEADERYVANTEMATIIGTTINIGTTPVGYQAISTATDYTVIGGENRKTKALFVIEKTGSDPVTINGDEYPTKPDGTTSISILKLPAGTYHIESGYHEVVSAGPDVTPPSLTSATIADADPDIIVLDYNETLDSASVPANGDFSVSMSRTVTSVAIVGDKVNVTVNTPFANGDAPTISYTAGTNKIQDAAGNDAANLTTQAITNNIAGADLTAPVFQSAAVQNAAPSIIELEYDETLDSGSVPAAGDFSLNLSRTVSSVAIVGDTVKLTVNSPYANGDAPTVSYTPGTNKIQDASGNDAIALTTEAVTNNIAGAGPAPIIYDSVTNLIESPSGVWIPSTMDAAFGHTGASTTQSIPAATDGMIQITYNIPSDSNSAAFGLHTSAVQLPYTSMLLAFQFDLNSEIYYIDNAAAWTKIAGHTAATGNLYRINRTSGVSVLEFSTNSGSSWTTLYTYTAFNASGSANATLYPVADLYGDTNSGLNDPIIEL